MTESDDFNLKTHDFTIKSLEFISKSHDLASEKEIKTILIFNYSKTVVKTGLVQ